MAANGVARKAPSPPAKASLVDNDIMRKVIGDKKDRGLTLKIKKSAPKPTISGNWKESDASNKDSPSTGSVSPIVNAQDEKTLAGFANGHPVEDKVDVVQCKHCRRPVLRAASATHVRECLNKKQEKLKKKKEAKEAKDAALRKEKGEDDDTGKNARKAVKGTVVDGEGAKKGKKRKLEDGEGKPGSKKKKKDEPKPKGAKPKGPVDVEKQCGVVLPNGGACARSLTCKSHSMGLKRAVPGRSLPYDMLLAQYQKKNQAKQQRAAIDANAPLPEDLEPSGAVDPDEEKDAIMTALSRHRPVPIATFTPVSLSAKYQFRRMKDMLRSALGNPPSATSTSTGNPPTSAALPTFDQTPMAAGMRGIALGGIAIPGSASSTEGGFPSAGLGGFAQPGSAGLDAAGSRRGSALGMGIGMGAGMGVGLGGQRMIAPGQLPGPQRKGSMASVGGAS